MEIFSPVFPNILSGIPFFPVKGADGVQCESNPVEVAATAAIDEALMKFRRLMYLFMAYSEL